ncbi:hypothetical protein LOZ12_002904 [Ophidiomyces ophidiicola]|uniref:Uncharacterized protein n=1 Tax=Ophidiomyces ophidiicola TaxID=1387563 RepID=A0ACB8UYR7_9EURO|nr:hypothetical protein LOZ61_002692 [Ophidiomyces ophidiicola]KAI1917273.1 hypothetical protein LOZ64_003110 [Ophidiomyces ophidiicola]KAI1930276.1 hypothetical protein LOZ60_001059 [Ophidiomyces ophidiicola]KAI1953303.1 hypothetical protein LOZ62_001144 [Ophidiomyces ophidiicola]KAI1968113.1 hypothetical protein LOZ59_000474 [Ophidiomyces ophidiicola]
MSSGFVVGGTTDYTPEKSDAAWQKVKQELEESRKRRADPGTHEGGKSLYEILQQNKAAKQEAFEESIRLKNQFRTLDEDEVEFLDSVLESTRAKEAAVKQETMEQLEIFHRQRDEAEKKAFLESNPENMGTAGSAAEDEQWTISTSKKRRRPKEHDALPGVKLRKSYNISSGPRTANNETHSDLTARKVGNQADVRTVLPKAASDPEQDEPREKAITSVLPTTALAKPFPKASSALGLGAYSSDDDD